MLLKEALSKEVSARKSRSEVLLAFECFLMYFGVLPGSPFRSYIRYNLSVYFTSMVKKNRDKTDYLQSFFAAFLCGRIAMSCGVRNAEDRSRWA